jgi:hypothetical protein
MRLVPALVPLVLVSWLSAAEGVPVTSVVLYNAGVGYYEHAGSITGTVSEELRFKTGQINDVLKSLVVQDLDGGAVGTVEYPGQAPLERTLRSFQVDVTGNPPLAQLLNQLRGAQVTATISGETVKGTVLGCESRQKPGDDAAPVTVPVLNLVTATGVRQLELDLVQGVSLDDARLQQELSRALAAVAGARDQDAKPVTINFAGAGQRRVRIGYVVEAPVWKTSYRLVMPAEGQDMGQLQGWAIVENQTDSDWSEVELRLVSGQPISFIQDLYRPLYAQRPVVEPPLPAGIRPVAYDGGRSEAKDGRMARSMPKGGRLVAPAAATLKSAESLADGLEESVGGANFGSLDPTQGVHSQASAAQVGELFQYQVAKVSLPRQRSAMLPIITDPIIVRRISIYNDEVNARHPLNGAWLTNSTGKHLQTGPITVFDGGVYGGDARIDHLAPGARRLVSYALDIPVTVDATTGDEQRRVTSGTLSKGVLQLQTRLTAARTYAIANAAAGARSVVVEHRFRHGWSAVDTPAPEEVTPTHWRFVVPVAASGQGALTVRETILTSEVLGLIDLDAASVTAYAADGSLPAAVRDVLSRAAGLKGVVTDAERAMQQTQEALRAIGEDQARIRENLRQVNQNTPYYQRLLGKLNEQESKVEQFQGTLENQRATHAQARAALEEFLRTADAK